MLPLLRRAVLPLAILCLGQALTFDRGFYTPLAFQLTLAACALALVACVAPSCRLRLPAFLGCLAVASAAVYVGWWTGSLALAGGGARPALVSLTALGLAAVSLRFCPDLVTGLLQAAALILVGRGALGSGLLYPRTSFGLWITDWAGVLGYLVTLVLIGLASRRHLTPALRVAVCALFLCAALARTAAIVASPAPWIDVYTAQHEAAEHLLHGRNPYGAAYTDTYHGGRATPEDGYPFYPPLPFLLEAPVVAVGLDVRVVLVVCELLAALALLVLGARHEQCGLAALAAAVYLFHPNGPHLTEQSWYEPILAGLLGWGLVLAPRRPILGHGLLALALTGKQYGIIALLPLLRAVARPVLLLGLVALSVVLVLLPFFVGAPSQLLHAVLFYHLTLPPRPDAITIASRCINTGIALPVVLLRGLEALLILAVLLRAGRGTWAAATATGTTLLIFFFFHGQAFINYYMLCQYLFLLAVAAPDDEGA